MGHGDRGKVMGRTVGHRSRDGVVGTPWLAPLVLLFSGTNYRFSRND